VDGGGGIRRGDVCGGGVMDELEGVGGEAWPARGGGEMSGEGTGR
jgi:hypothetical protein